MCLNWQGEKGFQGKRQAAYQVSRSACNQGECTGIVVPDDTHHDLNCTDEDAHGVKRSSTQSKITVRQTRQKL
jgi:hypothetical protein